MHIQHISVQVNGNNIISDLSLLVPEGQIHAIMGPNGSGKSSLAYTIAGHPHYQLTAGTLQFKNSIINAQRPDQRAQSGIFLAYQQPITLPGVSVRTLFTESWHALAKPALNAEQLNARICNALAQLGLDSSFLDRSVNEECSGGQKKRLEMAQAIFLEPQLIILDEIDSGLDLDALMLVGKSVALLRQANPLIRIMIITHYPRLLHYIIPDMVHLMCNGRIVLSGDMHLAQQIEANGYDLNALRSTIS